MSDGFVHFAYACLGGLLRAVSIGALILSAAAAAPKDYQAEVKVMGRGLDSCAAWMSAPADIHQQGIQWIQGFMTGRFCPLKKENVPISEDAGGILGEVVLICRANPSLRLVEAADQAWFNLMHMQLDLAGWPPQQIQCYWPDKFVPGPEGK